MTHKNIAISPDHEKNNAARRTLRAQWQALETISAAEKTARLGMEKNRETEILSRAAAEFLAHRDRQKAFEKEIAGQQDLVAVEAKQAERHADIDAFSEANALRAKELEAVREKIKELHHIRTTEEKTAALTLLDEQETYVKNNFGRVRMTDAELAQRKKDDEGHAAAQAQLEKTASARARAAEYPCYGDQIEAIYAAIVHLATAAQQGENITRLPQKFLDMAGQISAVKAKHPKPESEEMSVSSTALEEEKIDMPALPAPEKQEMPE